MSEQPQSHRHRAEQDEPFHDEPTAPAAEHVASLRESRLAGRWFEVEMHAYGVAKPRIEAADGEEAMEKAHELVPGFVVTAGGVVWEIENVTEVDAP